MTALNYEAVWRIAIFLSVFVVMGCWEVVTPRRLLHVGKSRRWFHHLALLALNSVAMRFVLPLGAMGIAREAQLRQWGLFNLLGWSAWVEGLLALIALDFVIYLQHVLFHAVPWFWRLHLVHHADPDFDVTTGLRFHTFEIALSMAIKAAAIAALGAAPVAVLIFELILNAMSMFNHSNVKLPTKVDGFLRWFLVTPDMHRVHHSDDSRETNRNFGFNVPWWDYLFGTYLNQPREGHVGMRLGLSDVPSDRAVTLPWLLLLPFVSSKAKATGRIEERNR